MPNLRRGCQGKHRLHGFMCNAVLETLEKLGEQAWHHSVQPPEGIPHRVDARDKHTCRWALLLHQLGDALAQPMHMLWAARNHHETIAARGQK